MTKKKKKDGKFEERIVNYSKERQTERNREDRVLTGLCRAKRNLFASGANFASLFQRMDPMRFQED